MDERREWTERKNKKGKMVFLTILLLIVLAGGGFLAKKHYDLRKDYNYLEQNKDSIVDEEVNQRLEQVQMAEREIVLEEFREGLGLKGNTLAFLRSQYKDSYLVYQISSKYLFEPILDVPMADYSDGEFVTDEKTKLKSFEVDGKSVTSHVVDVSKYQGDIDWKAVKSYGIDGAMIRAGIRGYGSGEIVADTNFDTNMKNALAEGLKTGAYFFSEAITVEEAKEEAEFLLNAVKPYKVKLPLVLDLEMIDGDDGRNEKLSKEEMTKVALAFMKEIEDAGYQAMLYGNIRTISEMVDLTQFEDYGLWFAYYSNEIYIPYKVSMWQYASDGKVDGISTDCDVNLMFTQE